jgi:hypothetical protein
MVIAEFGDEPMLGIREHQRLQIRRKRRSITVFLQGNHVAHQFF